MIQFHNAFDTEDNIVNIDEVTRENRARHYFCIGCGAEMSAVLGEKKQHHFRHKETHCSWESYLHKLGKKKPKERFDTQKDFIISYYVERTCTKATDCKLARRYSRELCNKRILHTVNLKELYDTCEEEVTYNGFRADLMLSHSEHPERKPVFLEISVTHDCESEKLAAGIEIIELKITDEKDVLRPLVENESLFMDITSQNPYSYQSMPPIRFYNFQRNFTSWHSLLRFWLSKEDNGTLRGNAVKDGLSCQDVIYNHREDSVFEVAIPEGVLINDKRCNVFDFAMMRAFRRGFDVKYCKFCMLYNGCRCVFNVEEIDEKTGEKRVVARNFKISSLTDENVNMFFLASICKKYVRNQYLVHRIERYYRDLTYWEWKKEE